MMGVLKGLFDELAEKAWADHGVISWLWLVALRDGRVMQMTFTPGVGMNDAARLSSGRYGASVLKLVPVPGIDRLLSAGEAARAVMGVDLGTVLATPMTPKRWLERVAWSLGCSVEHLLSSGKVAAEDAEECSGMAPYLAAELIRASGWTPSEPVL